MMLHKALNNGGRTPADDVAYFYPPPFSKCIWDAPALLVTPLLLPVTLCVSWKQASLIRCYKACAQWKADSHVIVSFVYTRCLHQYFLCVRETDFFFILTQTLSPFAHSHTFFVLCSPGDDVLCMPWIETWGWESLWHQGTFPVCSHMKIHT